MATKKKQPAKTNERIEKNFLYHGLGFPVILDEVIIEIDGDEEYYQINFESIQIQALNHIMSDPNVELTGGMLKFVRQTLEMSTDEMAQLLKKVKSTISKWETNKREEFIKLTPLDKFRIKTEIKNYFIRMLDESVESVLETKSEKTAKKKPIKLKTVNSLNPITSIIQIGANQSIFA